MKARLALVAGLALFVASSWGARGARAQEGPRADNRARAQQLFDSALADAQAGNFAAACPKFLASQEADPKTSTLLNLANCYEKNGQTASAWGAFREAETLARRTGRADWESAARSRADALEPKLVRLTIVVPEASRVPGLVVARDHAKLPTGEWGVAIPVDPGEHVVTASAEGRKSWDARVTVRESSGVVSVPRLDEVAPPAPIAPAPIAPAPAREPPPRPSWWTPMRTAGVAVAAAGGAAVIAGSVLGLVANGKYDSAKSQCKDGARGCPSGAVADSDAAYGLATGATIAFVAGAVALAGGAALVVLAPAPEAPRLAVGPGSIGVSGRW
jgi:hypothetical protein